jgi:penicillin-binding protein 2
VLPHAWFAAYTNANYPNRPDIAVAVIVENGGEGSEWAAPITRRILELYFLGYPAKLFPWEASYNVWETPEPPGGEEPDP